MHLAPIRVPIERPIPTPLRPVPPSPLGSTVLHTAPALFVRPFNMPPNSPATVHILRHGQSLHNVDRNHQFPDPPLTDIGRSQAKAVNPVAAPDLIVVSPMTRTLETTLLAFDSFLGDPESQPIIQVWPELRETHDFAVCNRGVSRAELELKFPQFDFSECRQEWDYPQHNPEDAVTRAETVRRRLKNLSGSHKNIFLVTHRGFIAFLVKGQRFDVAECRRYRFATEAESEMERHGQDSDTGMERDFGPTVLVPL
ncbi:histidine phosphatase superfamily [Cercophora scortea]|uniref:Histidine phosphatase superfamily n=1 Tax=Cercophora scortea TaxID=314031 RepID=A0AAE0INU0_9PEZI|nr:histidine phosphatase superfamily [Cercophora scortea]